MYRYYARFCRVCGAPVPERIRKNNRKRSGFRAVHSVLFRGVIRLRAQYNAYRQQFARDTLFPLAVGARRAIRTVNLSPRQLGRLSVELGRVLAVVGEYG